MTAFNIDRFTTSGAPDLAFGARSEITTTFPQTTLGQGDDGAGGAAENILVGGRASSAAPSDTEDMTCRHLTNAASSASSEASAA